VSVLPATALWPNSVWMASMHKVRYIQEHVCNQQWMLLRGTKYRIVVALSLTSLGYLDKWQKHKLVFV